MSRLHKYGLPVAIVGLAFVATLVLALFTPAEPGQRRWSPRQVIQAVEHPRRTYALWWIDRETKLVKRVIRDADICLSANGGYFSRTKPLGPDGRPAEAFGTNVLPSSVLPPPDACPRAVVAVRLATGWTLRAGSKNPSGTDGEDFALDVATKVKACGVRRIIIYQESYGDYCRIFDGEVPTLQAIHAQVRGLQARYAGL